MVRYRNIYYLLSFLILGNGISIAQQPINFGKTLLVSRSIDLNKVKCEIIPEIVFDTNNRELIITLRTKWRDKNSIQIENSDNYLYLVDNFTNWKAAIKEGVNSFTSSPQGVEEKIMTTKSLVAYENGKKITIDPFNKGYMDVTKTSLPIKLKIAGSEKNKIIIDFSFTYLKGDKKSKNIEEVDQKLSWSFLIPTRQVLQNDCQLIKLAYSAKISEINEKYSELDFINRLDHAGDEITDMENRFNEFKEIIASAKNLISEIDKDESLNSCQETRVSLLHEIKSKIPIEINIEELTKTISEFKNKKLTSKEVENIEYKKEKNENDNIVQKDMGVELINLKKEYEKIYTDLYFELDSLTSYINIKQADIETRLSNNDKRIYSVHKMFSKKEQLPADSLVQMTNSLEFSIKENQDDYDLNSDLLVLIRNYKSKIDIELSRCKSDFQNIDKKTFPKEGSGALNKINELITQTIIVEGKLEKQQELIGRHNKLLGDLITKKIGNEELQLTINLFNANFNEVLGKLKNLQHDYIKLETDIENKIISRWYFKWVRNNLLTNINDIKTRHIVIKASFDSLIIIKDSAFRRFQFDPKIEARQEFEKVETGFNLRIDTLKTRVIESIPEPFPYLYAVLSIVLLTILIFGITVYYLALRKKKIKETNRKSTDKNSVSTIKLQHSENHKPLKGLGLSEYLKKSQDRFLELDLSYEWDDSAIKKVYFDRECIIKTYRFFEDSIHAVGSDVTANETGGYLIGQWDYNKEDTTKYDVSLEDFIEPGDDAAFSKYQLNFGAKIGVKLQKVLDIYREKTQRDFVMTAWFHSHPGLKIFLSDYDLNVQEDFAGSNNNHRMIALVLDPYTPLWDIGIFTYKSNGEMNNAVNSKKFFSFDSMYQWALNPQSKNNMVNYFTFNLMRDCPDSTISKVYFSNPGILEIKRFIEDAKLKPNNEGITAFLTGEKGVNSPTDSFVLIDNVIRENSSNHIQLFNENKIIGALICLSCKSEKDDGKVQHLLNEFELINEKMNILLSFNVDEDSFVLISKIKGMGFTKLNQEGKTKIFLSDLIEWTRKRK
jgi:hypothetical protein